MRLVRCGPKGCELPGVLLPDGRIVDASGLFIDFSESFFATNGLQVLAAWVADGCPGGVELDPALRLGPPVARPSKIVCVGKNYLDHAREFGGEVPTEPTLFLKAPSAWSGPFDGVVRPEGAEKLDYEVELALVIGRTASAVPETAAMDHVAGYAVFCDFSERAFQNERCGQWTKGKSADTFAPLGPWLVTADEVPDPQALRLWSRVNGETRQQGWTGDMAFPVAFLISYISHFMTLLPGDVVATGTPGGVGMGMNPPCFLHPGDCVECGVDGLGAMKHRVLATP